MSQTVKHIIDIVAGILQDTASDEDDRHWSESELVDYYNQAVIEIISLNPSARAVTRAVKLGSGSKHSIPANGIKLLDIVRNMGSDGETPGEAVTKADLAAVEAFNRDWSTETSTASILNFMPDLDDPKSFYCYPPSDGTGYALMRFSEAPDKVVWDSSGNWESTLVAITDDFVDALTDKVLEYAYKKDSDFPGNKQREDDSGNEFMQEIAARSQ